jgi:hypothetical protein
MLFDLLDIGVDARPVLALINIQLGMITDGVKHFRVFTSGYV